MALLMIGFSLLGCPPDVSEEVEVPDASQDEDTGRENEDDVDVVDDSGDSGEETGVPDSVLLVDVTDAQWVELCEERGPRRTYVCDGDGYSCTVSLGYDDIEECDTDGGPVVTSDCEATVGDLRACYAAMEALFIEDACSTETPAECDELLACT